MPNLKHLRKNISLYRRAKVILTLISQIWTQKKFCKMVKRVHKYSKLSSGELGPLINLDLIVESFGERGQFINMFYSFN